MVIEYINYQLSIVTAYRAWANSILLSMGNGTSCTCMYQCQYDMNSLDSKMKFAKTQILESFGLAKDFYYVIHSKCKGSLVPPLPV